MLPLKSSIICIALAILVASCSSSTTPNTDPVPGVGSRYIRISQSFDTAQGIDTYTESKDTIFVLRKGQSVFGKNDVIEIGDSSSRYRKGYLHTEANGDLSVGSSERDSVVWTLLPFASRAPVTTLDRIDTQGIQVVHETEHREYIGDTILSIGGQIYNSRQSRSVFTYHSEAPGEVEVKTTTTTFAWIPNIQNFGSVKTDILDSRTVGGSTSIDHRIGVTTIISVDLK